MNGSTRVIIDRRQFVRIKAPVILRYRHISEKEFALVKRSNITGDYFFSADPALLKLSQEIRDNVADLTSYNEGLKEPVQSILRKIDLFNEDIKKHLDHPKIGSFRQNISLSLGGVEFSSPKKFMPGSQFVLLLSLLPQDIKSDPHGVKVCMLCSTINSFRIGVYRETDGPQYFVRATFDHFISEDDESKLKHYLAEHIQKGPQPA